MLVMACWSPDYTTCGVLETKQYETMEECEMDRIPTVGSWQTQVYEGWITFSDCEFINPEENGRLG